MIWRTIGFDKNKKLFENLVRKDRLGHAYLFSGQEMIGKKTFALELANLVTGQSTPDIYLISAAGSESGQTIAIEEIRKIKNDVSLSPSEGRYKFIIIDDANLMTAEAQNALLKVLEEPNPSSILILVTANSEALLPTVISRCEEIRFQPHPKMLLEAHIKNSKLSKNKTDFLIEFADGRLGLMMKVIEEDSFDEIKSSVEELMRLAKIDINERFIAAQKLTDDKNKVLLSKHVLYWILYLRTRLNEPKAHKILKNLLVLHSIIGKPQFNQRLALESFLVSL